MAEVNTGLSEEQRAGVAEALNKLLADTYTLYLQTHRYHWNVTGPMFNTLHTMFEEQYREMWAAVDEVAERIRALGAFAPGSYEAFAELTEVKSGDNSTPSAQTMIANLLEGHETLVRRARQALEVADAADDAATEDLITVRIQTHEKTAWMLRAMLG
ncbi:MAG: Dps family protein [Pseudomonadota bacterium]